MVTLPVCSWSQMGLVMAPIRAGYDTQPGRESTVRRHEQCERDPGQLLRPQIRVHLFAKVGYGISRAVRGERIGQVIALLPLG